MNSKTNLDQDGLSQILTLKNQIDSKDRAVINELLEKLYAYNFIYPFDGNCFEKYKEYLDYFEDRTKIREADIETLRRIITSIARMDRFNDGLIEDALENGCWSEILDRLEDLTEEV